MTGRVSWFEKVLKPDPDKIAASFGWLEKFLTPEADRAERRFVDQFAAYRWDGSDLTQDMVRDISSTGLYLLTRESWQPGTILTLTLQREGPLDLDPTRRITTQAKVMRCGADGVGLSFLWSKEDPESRQWEALLECLIAQANPGDMVSLVRIVEAFAFLGRICSNGAEQIGEWVRTRASSLKIRNAVSIALKAENLLGPGSERYSLRINPHVAVRILEVGSGTEEDWLQGFWAGLLITAGSADQGAETNLEFVELFSQLTSIPIRVFTVICTRSIKVISESGISAKPLACDLEELTATVGSRGTQTERDLASLAALQLIERQAANAPALLRNNQTYITPTSLGLQLFALCNGHRGTLRDFYFLDSVEAVAMRIR
jgi:PilZ domain